MQEEHLAMHLGNRPTQLREAKNKGFKIIGYFPGNYVPEELIYASGAVPLCLIDGGDTIPVDASSSALPHIFCPFARAQVGERLLKRNPYYSMIDMLVAPITCQHLKKVSEIWEYYADRLRVLKDRLQAFTGNEITSTKLGEAIDLYNRMRELLKKISLMRRVSSPPLSALDFIKLNHASFYADPAFMVDVLDSVYRELEETQKVTKVEVEAEAPRLLLLGPNVSYGDYKVLQLVKEGGGEIVIEELCEGIRYYWQSIENKGDLFQSLAKGYLADRLPCAFMRNSAKKRLDFALKLVSDFDVSGVIWYELLGCETYDAESYFFAQRMGERNIPILILESDYGMADVGQILTRVSAFIELVKRGGIG
jgi:benzoyl-CoA reductase/2-hydroxyglutaryl-CoA dehydratase subunit BcrC/BadD/HgdB